jgi:hypothetical protein
VTGVKGDFQIPMNEGYTPLDLPPKVVSSSIETEVVSRRLFFLFFVLVHFRGVLDATIDAHKDNYQKYEI